MKEDKLPPRPGEPKPEAVKQHGPAADAVPLYVQGLAIPLTEQEALGVIAQLSGALQTRMAGQARGEAARNG